MAATVAACAMLSGEAAGQQATWPQQDATADPGSGYADPYADPYAAPAGQEGDPAVYGTAPQATGLRPAAAITSDEEADFDQQDYGRENLPETPVDGQAARGADSDPTGIRVGTMILRPSLTQGLLYEKNSSGNQSDSTLYSSTQLKGTLTSDWSRHELTVTSQGTWETVLSGEGDEGSGADIGAELRLDLSELTVARLTAAYSFSREDSDNDEAIEDATTQYGIHRFDAGASIERDFGLLRGTVGVNGSRWIHTDATLANGDDLSQSYRDRSLGEVSLRIGYELSPALIPFVEASAGRLQYDQEQDPLGYERSSNIYTGKIGIAADFREKLQGEIGIGYTTEKFDDDRLDDLNGIVFAGNLSWSPRYGTDVKLDLSTGLDPSSAADTSGSVVYETRLTVTQQVRENLVASLSGATAWTKYPDLDNSDSTEYSADAELSYEINRYLALVAGLGYEYTTRDGGIDDDTLRATVGITAKR
ncbi:outer membrane beta-barrel protein [Pseudomonas sp. R2.Fl]|nr:outer membrane beta-barrel protein [Pseudomonas sp. R2.Fl]